MGRRTVSSSVLAGQESAINRHIKKNPDEYNQMKRQGYSDIQIKGKLRQKYCGSARYHGIDYIANADKNKLFKSFKK